VIRLLDCGYSNLPSSPYVPLIINPIWVFPKIGVPQNGWFIMEKPIEMDDLGYPYFWKHPKTRLFLVGIYWVYIPFIKGSWRGVKHLGSPRPWPQISLTGRSPGMHDGRRDSRDEGQVPWHSNLEP